MKRKEIHNHKKFSRRNVLKLMGVTAGGGVVTIALNACGTAPAPTAAPPTVTPLPPPPTLAPTQAAGADTAPAVATVNVVAKEFVFEMDSLVAPAGKVHFTFKNAGKMTHDFWIYAPQDLTAYLAKKRAGEKVKGKDYLKGATELFDLEAGKSGENDIVLQPGYYEVSCFVQSKNPDGSTFPHIDKGQVQWLTVTGPGFPPAPVTPANTIAVEMKGEEGGAWLFVPDKLVAPAGEVTFKVTNSMKMAHDFVVHPLGDASEFITKRLGGAKGIYPLIKGEELMEDLGAGKTDTKTMKLTPGFWVAACYIVGKNPDGSPFLHSDRGQRFVFTVK